MRYLYLSLILLLSVQLSAQKKQNQSIGFIQNKGQIVDQKGKKNDAVKYLLNTNGLNVQLRNNGFSYDVYETKKHPLPKNSKEKSSPTSIKKDTLKNPNYTLEYLYHRIDIDFENSNRDVKLDAEGKSSDYDNYYNVPDEPNGILNVYKFQKITYQNIYPNIDVVFLIPGDQSKPVEYNFIVKPNGKISDIKLKFNGVKTELVDNKIKMDVRFGQMEETLPLSWTENENNKEEIAISYKKLKKNAFGFESLSDTSTKTVIIDPVPVRLWGTYYGGSGYDFYTSTVKVDLLDNVYLSGKTISSDNIATSGAFLSIITGPYYYQSSYLGKLDSNGIRLWGTYVHNNNVNIPINETSINDIVINSSSEVYIVGTTAAIGGVNNLATSGSHKEFGNSTSSVYGNGIYDGFIIKFDSNGQRIWGTLFGGDNEDRINTINLDSQENIIIGGLTYSDTNISTLNSFQPTADHQYGQGGFFCKFSPSGTQLYGSYFPREINCSAIDSDDNLIFAGEYEISSYWPDISTVGAHQRITNYQDGFIIKFNSFFNRLWCTYYGGSTIPSTISPNADVITGISVDSNKNIYVCGYTDSVDGIATTGAYKETHNSPISSSDVDAFLVKFNTDGVRQWGTFFGDNNNDQDKCYDGKANADGDFYIVGTTNSPNNIATPNSYQSVIDQYSDGYFCKFNTNGQLSWSTYFGGDYVDSISNIDVKNNVIYISGETQSSNKIATSGTHKSNVEGGDAFVEKFIDCVANNTTIGSNSPICIGNTIQLNASGGTSYSWTGPNGFMSSLQNPTIANANTSHNGDYSCVISGTGGCDGTNTVTVVVGNTNPPVPSINPLPEITGDCNTTVTIPTAMSACDGMINGATSNPTTYNLPGTYTIVWNYNDGNGNTATQNQTVTISAVILPTTTTPQIFCIQQNATINDIIVTGQNIKWYDALTGGNLLANITLLQNGITYYASQTINGCESTRVPVMITVQNTPAPTGSDQSFCTSQNPTLNDFVVNGTNINWYSDATSSVILPMNTPLTNATTYYATQTVNNCESLNRLAITVSLINTLNANNFSQEICDDLNEGIETIDLSSYNSNLISSTTNCTFSYYNSLVDAENGNVSGQINNPSNHSLRLGLNVIYVRILSDNGCYQIVELKLTLLAEPKITINDAEGLCENSSITINAGNGFDSYIWSTGATSSSIVVTTAGNYSVTVTENHSSVNCSSTKNFTVVASNKATISQIITADWTDNDNTITVLLSDSSIGDYEYSLDGVIFQDSNIFSGLKTGIYTVTVRDKNGCGSVKDDVYLLFYPNFFTPNGDGFNDFWSVKYSRFEPGLKVELFDRYGKFIKELHFNESWDGRYNGLELPATDYWFVVTRVDGKQFKGHFTLKR